MYHVKYKLYDLPACLQRLFMTRAIREFKTTAVQQDHQFWEPHKKTDRFRKEYKIKNFKEFRENTILGWRLFKEESVKMKNEIWDDIINADPRWIYVHGDMDKVWQLNKQEDLEKWKWVSDRDHGDGFSTASLVINEYGKGLFSGFIDPRKVEDGQEYPSGYANITSVVIQKSFNRDSAYDWQNYTHLVLRVRGDGRSYMINLHTPGEYDISWHDLYCYALYTRGGPYWQTTKIPFSKFFFQARGRIQDIQEPMDKNRVNAIGITLSDDRKGPFHLEIDYIGVEVDRTHKEECAYEMYDCPKYIVGQ